MMPNIPSSNSVKSGVAAPHILMCQLFRWPDLPHSDIDMKRLSFCNLLSDNAETAMPESAAEMLCSFECNFEVHLTRLYKCCNPYYWSRHSIIRSSSSHPPSKIIHYRICANTAPLLIRTPSLLKCHHFI